MRETPKVFAVASESHSLQSLSHNSKGVSQLMSSQKAFSLVSLGYLCVNSVPDSFTIARQHGGLWLISVTAMSTRGW